MGKKKRKSEKRKSNNLELTPQQFKKQKTSNSSLAQIPGALFVQNSEPDNPSANAENQKPETASPLESAKKKKKKKKKKNASGLEQEPETVAPIESVTKKKKKKSSKNKTTREILKEQLKGIYYFKGKPLDDLLENLSRAIEATGHLKGKVYDNIWMKQRFSVGINDVTRTLERMPVALDKSTKSYKSDFECSPDPPTFDSRGIEDNGPNKQFVSSETKTWRQDMHLQAVLTAIDCHPHVLVSHLPGLASSRDIPLFSVEDHGTASQRLGKLLKLNRAVAIGVKVGESIINKVIQDAIDDQVMR